MRRGTNNMLKFGLRSFKWPLKSKDVDRAIATVERSKTALALAISVDLMLVSNCLYRKLPGSCRCNVVLTLSFLLTRLSIGSSSLQDTHLQAEALQEQVTATHLNVKTMAEGELRAKMAHWLTAPDPTSNFEDARRNYEASMSEWFFQGSNFKTWV